MKRHASRSPCRWFMIRPVPAILLVFLATGCGPSKPIVKGIVTLDGTPIEKGTIMLMPVDGKGQTAGGGIEAGRYSFPASVGTVKVIITAHRKDGTMPDPLGYGSGAMIDRYVNYVPERYNEKTDLTVAIKPGLNTHDFTLEGGAPPSAGR